MDVSEDNNDVKLYRSSAKLITDLELGLSQLLFKPPRDADRRIRQFVLYNKYEELNQTLDSFQEWPQLLDPKLPYFISLLNDAFLSYLSSGPNQYAPDKVHAAIPLPRVICKLLYTFCKVRGQKVIVRFLSNEPRHLQPMINAFQTWSASKIAENGVVKQENLSWEEKYILLIWLSHLMLIPFDLATASYGTAITSAEVLGNFSSELPPVAISVLTLGFEHLNSAGKERESAAALVVRLALRPDMRAKGALDDLVKLTLARLKLYETDSALASYHLLGTLSVLSGVFNSGSDEDVAPFIVQCFNVCHRAALLASSESHTVNSLASSRKLLIKTMRSIILKSILLESKSQRHVSSEKLSEMLEGFIDYLLMALADKDTPIRFAASKALSMITLKLDLAMAAEVAEAVIGSLGENLLYEMPGNGKLVAATELPLEETVTLRPVLTAVDPLRWQGLMLTLAHLLYRRCPPVYQLPDILKALLNGLDFEQRTPTGVSIGTGVRDAACFGLWALSRKYSTSELMKVSLEAFQFSTAVNTNARATNVLQVVACTLVNAACLDPSGNIRRGSSAALQELIGRHPDTVDHGIMLVQTVEYHTIARRSRAILEIGEAAARLSPVYHHCLSDALQGWRGIRSGDPESRRVAAIAIGHFCLLGSASSVNNTISRSIASLDVLPIKGSGSVIENRHGLILAVSSAIDSSEITDSSSQPERIEQAHAARLLNSFNYESSILGEPLKRSSARSDLLFEAASALISSLCNVKAVQSKEIDLPKNSIDFILERLGIHLESQSDIVIETSTKAMQSLFKVLPPGLQSKIISEWLGPDQQKLRTFSSKGRIYALGAISGQLDDLLGGKVVSQLQDFVLGPWTIEIRTMALKSLADAQAATGREGILAEIDPTPVLRTGLSDYTTDQRGDIGSLARLEAVRYFRTILDSWPDVRLDDRQMIDVVSQIARLAAEKLDKVRYQAWICLQIWWQNPEMAAVECPSTDVSTPTDHRVFSLPTLSTEINHLAETSSEIYFRQLLTLCQITWLRQALLQGLISSACQGTEAIVRTSRSALVDYILSCQHQSDRDPAHVTTKDRVFPSYPNMSLEIYTTLLTILEQNLSEDRYAIPAVEILGFLLTQGLVDFRIQSQSRSISPSQPSPKTSLRKTFTQTQKSHFKTSSVPRLEAALLCYSGLLHYISKSESHFPRSDSTSTSTTNLQNDIVKKLTSMLLHPYPRIRNAVADTLYLHLYLDRGVHQTRPPQPQKGLGEEEEEEEEEEATNKKQCSEELDKVIQTLTTTNWSASSTKQLKEVVEGLRKEMGIGVV